MAKQVDHWQLSCAQLFDRVTMHLVIPDAKIPEWFFLTEHPLTLYERGRFQFDGVHRVRFLQPERYQRWLEQTQPPAGGLYLKLDTVLSALRQNKAPQLVFADDMLWLDNVGCGSPCEDLLISFIRQQLPDETVEIMEFTGSFSSKFNHQGMALPLTVADRHYVAWLTGTRNTLGGRYLNTHLPTDGKLTVEVPVHDADSLMRRVVMHYLDPEVEVESLQPEVFWPDADRLLH